MTFSDSQLIDQALVPFGIHQIAAPILILASVQNENYQILTDQGPLFIRIHPSGRKLSKIQKEHQILRWSAMNQIPTIVPLQGKDGKDIYEVQGRYVTLFPWSDGKTLRRGSIDERGATLLGDMQGRLHQALVSYEHEDLPKGGSSSSWNTDDTLCILTQVNQAFQKEHESKQIVVLEETQIIASILERQQKLLMEGAARPCSDFNELPIQTVHGDYHEGNVLVDVDQKQAIAVVDWELAGKMPRVFEFMRAIFYMLVDESPLLGYYLMGYRKHIALTRMECELAIEMWWQSVLHDTWALQQRFFHQNARVNQFFPQIYKRLSILSNADYRKQFTQFLQSQFFPST